MPETKRQQSLQRYNILGTLPESTFDEITQLAAEVCDVPMALIGFVDNERIWFKSHVGTDIIEAPREQTICGHMIEERKVMVLQDASLDPRFKDLPSVKSGLKVRFYAGAPLITPDGVVIGSLCVFSPQTKTLTETQIKSLERLARMAMYFLEARITDIDEKQKAQADLEKQKDFLNAVLENLFDGVIACDANGKVSLSNGASRRFHGLEQAYDEDVPPEKWASYFQLFHADGETLMKMEEIPLYRALHDQLIRDEEMVVRSVSGKKTKLKMNGQAIFGKGGTKLGAVITLHDITEQRNAVSREQATNMTLKKLIDLVPVGIALFDENKKITTWNKANEQITGWTEQELLGRSVYETIEASEADTESISNQVNKRLEKYAGELEYVTKSGKTVDLHLSIVPLFDGDGKRTGSMSVSVNISDIRERERRLVEANRALKEASAAKSDFLTNMSHEIRTPLNGVIAMSELMAMTDLTEEQKEMLLTVQHSASHLLMIVDDILDFSKVEAGKMRVENVKFDLQDIVEQSIRSVMPFADSKNLKVTTMLPVDLRSSFNGDPGRICQVLLNLVGNAIKFTEKGEISIALSAGKNINGKAVVRFEVADTGIGIPANQLDKLFKAFSQADGSMTRKYGGTGLGLSIAHGLIDLMGGKIGVDSVEGQGSKFWFTVPLEMIGEEKKQVTATPSTATDVPSISGMHILVAEDNAVNQTIARAMLTKLGATCEVVENGRLAVEALANNKYDLVLMDCQMPEMDGYEATRTIRSNGRPEIHTIPIVALTAHAMAGDREKCLDAGMDDYLTKPIHMKNLAQAISDIYTQRSALRAKCS
ncbi:ATP-binding protein [Bdellovibrio sp. SKB1291214]|uniref:ATP-binding protein n=1 Tax=Bdellovibrio sp. SKB1291214 TaxID=1732569 RepID=UPI000B51CE39|nr:ATP-binding protein [Bdellovibrio sp. SKB1291214]UYL09436.1 ATP-binding protein [Bdellovibrio sp. SKB1291214]